HPAVRDSLGWALEPEQTFTGRLQGFSTTGPNHFYVDHGKWGVVLRMYPVDMGTNTWEVAGRYLRHSRSWGAPSSARGDCRAVRKARPRQQRRANRPRARQPASTQMKQRERLGPTSGQPPACDHQRRRLEPPVHRILAALLRQRLGIRRDWIRQHAERVHPRAERQRDDQRYAPATPRREHPQRQAAQREQRHQEARAPAPATMPRPPRAVENERQAPRQRQKFG